ncbi:MAG TPA: class I SAM-dependent methyltransferase [Solirubrobacteraceae bacterium]|jgi:SAM-dependent methyltransferase|nr:class I SAM-dependent methyltransferase [Solirubrobacteraceae bacterium]
MDRPPERRCILCDTAGPFAPLYARDGWQLVRCRCGLVFQDPQPEAELLERSYYHDPAFTEALLGELRPITLDMARRKLALLHREGVALAGLRVLDVGASSGAWLEVAAAEGATGVGIELGETTASAARERGLDVRTGTLAQALPGLGGERFGLITFWDVLEHLHDPRAELALARELLAPGGRLAATFPNVRGLYPQLTYRLLAGRTGVWEYPELPVHLYDFAPDTARRLLERGGYAVQGTRTFATPYRFYRTTSLSPERTGFGRRGRALRAAFDALHLAAYPLARLTDRGNSQFVLAQGSQAN